MKSRSIKILIIDDDPIDRVVYQRLLSQNTSCTYEFTEAESGHEGLELLKSSNYDCVLLDYGIPDLDGIEFLKAIKNEKSCSNAPVVMLTGQGNEKVAVEAMKYGVKDYILKSHLTSSELFRAINNAVEKAYLAKKIEQEHQEFHKFASIAAHDLRDPIKNIQALCEKMESDPRVELDRGTEEYFGQIKENTEVMESLVHAIIQYTKTQRTEKPMNARRDSAEAV